MHAYYNFIYLPFLSKFSIFSLNEFVQPQMLGPE